MSETADIAQNQTPKELSAGKEDILARASRALNTAVSLSKGAAIVNIGSSGLLVEQLAGRLAGYSHFSINDILTGVKELPEEARGLVVSGYSSGIYQDPNQERKIEAFIRAKANMRGVNDGQFQVLVLSEDLPKPQILHDPDLPWYNGPFQGDDSV